MAEIREPNCMKNVHFSTATRRVEGVVHPCPPDVVWARSQLPGWRLLPCHPTPA